MARQFILPNVGSTGIRRIVPMVGIDFIAGDLKKKGKTVSRGTDKPYGLMPANMGGRTRKWSFVNFLQVNTSQISDNPSNAQMDAREHFATATRSANATCLNLSSAALVLMDFKNGTIRQGVDPNKYATHRGWVAAVRSAQIAAGQSITPTTDTWSWS
jgi:hypothetical protein